MSFYKTKTKVQLSCNFTREFDRECLHPSKISVLGQSARPTCAGFEPIQQLLAVGFSDGSVKVYGKSALEITLKTPSCLSVRALVWDVNEGRLAAISSESTQVYIWNVKSHELCVENYVSIEEQATSKKLSVAKLDIQPTALGSLPRKKLLYAGGLNGTVHVLEWKSARVSSSRIQCFADEMSAVVAVAIHPQYETKLIVAYDSGLIVLIDASEGKAVKKYYCGLPISSFAIDPSARFVVCGHRQGKVSIVELKNEKKQPSQRPLCAAQSSHSISQVAWCTTADNRSLLLILGGNDSTEEPSLTVLRYDREDFSVLPNSQQSYFVGSEIQFFGVIKSSPFSCANPAGLLLFKGNDVSAISFDFSAPVPKGVPFSLRISRMNVVIKRTFENCSDEFLDDLESCRNVEEDEEFLLGGFPLRSDMSSTLTLVATENAIFFCRGVPQKIEPIFCLDLARMDDDLGKQKITYFDLCPVSRTMSVHFESGELLFLEFSFESLFGYKALSIAELPEDSEDSGESIGKINPLYEDKPQSTSTATTPAQSDFEDSLKFSVSQLPEIQVNDPVSAETSDGINVIENHFGNVVKITDDVTTIKVVGLELKVEKQPALLFPGFNPICLVKKCDYKLQIVKRHNLGFNKLVFIRGGKVHILGLDDLSVKKVFSTAIEVEVRSVSKVQSYVESYEDRKTDILLVEGVNGAIFAGHGVLNEEAREFQSLREADGQPVLFHDLLDENGATALSKPRKWKNALLGEAVAPAEEQHTPTSPASPTSPNSEHVLRRNSSMADPEKRKKRGLSKLFSKKPDEDMGAAHERHYLIILTRTQLAVHIDCSDQIAVSIKLEDAVAGQILRMHNGDILMMVVGENGAVNLFSLPQLTHLATSTISGIVAKKSISTLDDSSSRVFLYDLFSMERRQGDCSLQRMLLFNNLLEMPPAPTVASGSDGWFSSMFSSKSQQSKSAEELFFGAKEPSRPPTKAEEVQRQMNDDVFRQTHQALQERGEKLKALDSKTSDLAESSRGFAEVARKIREKQEKKKWYQF